MYRVALDLCDDQTELNIIRGDIVADFEDYLNVCTETWYRLQGINDRKAEEEAKKSND